MHFRLPGRKGRERREKVRSAQKICVSCLPVQDLNNLEGSTTPMDIMKVERLLGKELLSCIKHGLITIEKEIKRLKLEEAYTSYSSTKRRKRWLESLEWL